MTDTDSGEITDVAVIHIKFSWDFLFCPPFIPQRQLFVGDKQIVVARIVISLSKLLLELRNTNLTKFVNIASDLVFKTLSIVYVLTQ